MNLPTGTYAVSDPEAVRELVVLLLDTLCAAEDRSGAVHSAANVVSALFSTLALAIEEICEGEPRNAPQIDACIMKLFEFTGGSGKGRVQ
jgi:hypothetical protein